MTQVEVCVFSLDSAITAQHAGANTIELCGGQAEGGTTPSIGLIRCVRQAVSIPVYVMIRPRGGDFLYSDPEFEVMTADIDAVKDTGADGVVLGILKSDGSVDEERTTSLVERAKPLQVTFHRAFDMTRNSEEALESVIKSGCTRLLTSGQEQTALAGKSLLARLVDIAGGRLQIVAGSGVGAMNVSELMATGVHALHLSGSTKRHGGMHYKKEGISMATTVPGEYERAETDAGKLRPVINLVNVSSAQSTNPTEATSLYF